MPPPEIYFDPRSLAMDGKPKAVLHAKCVVVDGAIAFVSSANFTEAAQERNIEVGVLVRSPMVADRLLSFFSGLVATGAVRRGALNAGGRPNTCSIAGAGLHAERRCHTSEKSQP